MMYQVRTAARARQARIPSMIPARAPLERDGLLSLLLLLLPLESEFESESCDVEAFAGRASSVSDHETSQDGGFFAGVSVVSAWPIFCTLALWRRGPGAWERKSLFVCQFWARKAACRKALPRV